MLCFVCSFTVVFYVVFCVGLWYGHVAFMCCVLVTCLCVECCMLCVACCSMWIGVVISVVYCVFCVVLR